MAKGVSKHYIMTKAEVIATILKQGDEYLRQKTEPCMSFEVYNTRQKDFFTTSDRLVLAEWISRNVIEWRQF